jgi:transcriptional regulator with GAF, ATPase, and Fis domain
MLAAHFPVQAVLLRRLDRDPLRLITVASARVDTGDTFEGATPRNACDEDAAKQLTQFANEGNARYVSATRLTPFTQTILPPGLRAAAIALPLVVEERALGVVLLLTQPDASIDAEALTAAAQLIEPFSVAFENEQRLQELARMREALEADRRALLSRLERQDISDSIVGESAGLRSVMERVEQVAPTDAPVLILGETGSGKEVIARAIHSRSRRARGPVVRVNCGAIPPQLIDSELFGHERGSFTGAVSTRKGWFERADGGTLFLDELGELPLEAQVRLLRVLQEGSLERVGGHQAINVDVRIVAATHRNLEHMVAAGRFREDLWYRISVFPVRLPALRERAQDIPALATYFAQRAGQRLGGAGLTPTEHDITLLLRYPWPGNVRELIAVIERAAILGNGKRLELAKALGSYDEEGTPPTSLAEFRSQGPGVAGYAYEGINGNGNGLASSLAPREDINGKPIPLALGGQGANGAHVANGVNGASASDDLRPLGAAMVSHIERALQATHGRIEGPFGAAKLLGINPHTLRARMRKLGIDWSRFRPIKAEASG